MTLKNVEDFCFDVLGDFVDPKRDIRIDQDRNGNFRVIVFRTCGVPNSMFRLDWDRAVEEQPEFKEVSLYLPA